MRARLHAWHTRTIAIIIEDVNKIAGQERVVAELAARLVARHEIHVFCYEARDIPAEVIVHRLRRPPLRFFMVRALWMVIASWWAVRPGQFDVVLAQGGNALNQTHTLVHGCLARRWELTRREYWRLRPPSLSERLIRTVWYGIVVALERRAVRRCRAGRTLAVSYELADLLSHYHGVPREGIVVCENGLDHTHFRPDPDDPARAQLRGQLGLSDDDVLALFLGGIWLEKGATYSIEALAHLPAVPVSDHLWEASPEADTFSRRALESPPTGRAGRVHLCLAGRDDPAPFRALAERLGVADRLHFLPATDRPWEYYHAAEVFLFPGHAEGFGLVAVEAAACGLPVLMTRIGVAERLIEDGVSGYLIDRDAAPIAARLSELAADAQLRRHLAQGAAAAAEKFTWERQAAEIEAACERGQ